MVCLEHNANTPFVAAPVIFPYPNSYFADVPHFQSYTSVSFIITESRGIPLCVSPTSSRFHVVTSNRLGAFFIHITLDIDLRRLWYRNKLRLTTLWENIKLLICEICSNSLITAVTLNSSYWYLQNIRLFLYSIYNEYLMSIVDVEDNEKRKRVPSSTISSSKIIQIVYRLVK